MSCWLVVCGVCVLGCPWVWPVVAWGVCNMVVCRRVCVRAVSCVVVCVCVRAVLCCMLMMCADGCVHVHGCG